MRKFFLFFAVLGVAAVIVGLASLWWWYLAPVTGGFFELKKTEIRVGERDALIAYVRVPRADVSLRVVTTTSTVKDVAAPPQSVVVNGGFFDTDYSPSGFLKSDGVRIGTRMFDTDKSGVIFSDREIHITDALQQNFISSLDAVQSYPLLIADGASTIRIDSQKRARRTAVAVDAADNILIIVAPETEITLFEFARALERFEPKIITALNLDGGPSTGIAVHAGARSEIINSYTPVGNVLIFEKRPRQ